MAGGDPVLAQHGDHTIERQPRPSATAPWPPAWGDPAAWQTALAWCAAADFDPLRPILATAYHPTRGRPPIDPVTLLRALGLQVIFGEPSITAWVRTLQRTPLLARLCGWTGKIPAVGTFYGFLDRLYPDRPRRRGALRRPSGRKLKLRPGEKLPPKRPGATDRVARRVAREAGRPARPRVTDRWDALLAAIVQQSVARGVIPATWDLAVDGTPVESGAHSFGRKVCACPAKRCGCLRRFSDPDALLGWDSYRNRYYFGYNAVVLTVANAVPGQVAHPLVVSLALHPANRPDGIAYPDLLVKTQRRYAGTGCRLARVIGDAAFDVDALWTFTQTRGVTPVFAPHTPPQPPHLSAAAQAAGIRLGPDHRPICAADRPLVPHGWARRGVQSWGCPLRNKTAPPCSTPCAKAGQLVSVNFRGTRYDQLGLPYRSAEWDAVYAQRTASERANSWWAATGVKAARHRRRYVWYGRLVIAAIAQHIQTWVRTGA
jgi:hypothetical protein